MACRKYVWQVIQIPFLMAPLVPNNLLYDANPRELFHDITVTECSFTTYPGRDAVLSNTWVGHINHKTISYRA